MVWYTFSHLEAHPSASRTLGNTWISLSQGWNATMTYNGGNTKCNDCISRRTGTTQKLGWAPWEENLLSICVASYLHSGMRRRRRTNTGKVFRARSPSWLRWALSGTHATCLAPWLTHGCFQPLLLCPSPRWREGQLCLAESCQSTRAWISSGAPRKVLLVFYKRQTRLAMPLPLLPALMVGMIPGAAAAIDDHEVTNQPFNPQPLVA